MNQIPAKYLSKITGYCCLEEALKMAGSWVKGSTLRKFDLEEAEEIGALIHQEYGTLLF